MGRKKQMIKKDITPKVIKEYLDEVMVGQDEAKRRVAVEIYRHALRMDNEFELDDMGKSISKNNVLMTGLTGTGKTFMWQKIAEFLDIPIYIQDTTKMTASGYVGEDIENCLKGLLENADYDFDKAERGIIVLDELDKSSRKSEHPSVTRDVSGESVQQGLLKMLEGTISTIPTESRRHPMDEGTQIDTTNILFVGCGSFEGIEEIVKERLRKENKNERTMGFGATSSKREELSIDEIRANITREDLVKYGMLPELLGRFPIVTNLKPLHKEDMIDILKLNNGIFEEYKTTFRLMGKSLIIKDDVYEYIVDKALRENTGARGLRSSVEEIMFEIMYNAPSERKKRYVVDMKCLNSIEVA